jgi:hypothetical protein
VTECSNYRGISLLCVAYKIFSNILINRLTPYIEGAICDYQCGYCGGRLQLTSFSPYIRYFENVMNVVRIHIISSSTLRQHTTVQTNVTFYAAMEELSTTKTDCFS